MRKKYFLVLALLFFLALFRAEAKVLIKGKVTDAEGNPLRARIVACEEKLKEIIVKFSDSQGDYLFEVSAGKIILEASHGLEYEPQEIQLDVQEGQERTVNLILKRRYNMEELGWYCGDRHFHSTYSDGKQAPKDLIEAAKAEDLDWAILTDHNTIAGEREWLAETTNEFITIIGEEITNKWGHMTACNINKPVLLSNEATDEQISQALAEISKNSGLTFIAHPCFYNYSYTRWEVSNFDGLEIWNGGVPHNVPLTGNLEAKNKWFEFLNKGLRMAGVGGSDCHDIYNVKLNNLLTDPRRILKEFKPEEAAYILANYDKFKKWALRGNYLGIPRVYVHLKEFSRSEILKALKAGNAFITNGPLILINIAGKISGETLGVKKGQSVTLEIKGFSIRPMKSFNIIVNGELAHQIDIQPARTAEKKIKLKFDKPSWVIVECFGEYPDYAITNPIYIEIK